MNPVLMSALLLPVLAAAAGVAGMVGVRRWRRGTALKARRVEAAASSSSDGVYRPESIAELPAPVQRYFQRVLTPGQRLVRTARLEHEGRFRTSPDRGWAVFRSVQHVSADPPGFVWDATIDMVPLAGVRVRDSYLGGHAGMVGRIGGVVPVVNAPDTPELASGALHRFLAEAAWLPTALLPRPGLHWTTVDDATARVTLVDSGVEVSLDAHFNDAGELVRVVADRYRDVNGVPVLTPFEGTFGAYGEVDGMLIPLEGEVGWMLPDGRFPYWRGRVAKVEYGYGDDGSVGEIPSEGSADAPQTET